jgi:WXG100 family type VII secretion target
MTSFSIQPDSLVETASSIDAAAERTAAETATLASARDMLLGGWEGDAADAYASQQARWLTDMTRLAGVGRAAADAARTAAQAYRDADDAVGRAWSL